MIAARGSAHMKLHVAGTVNKLKVEHRTPNIERSMFDVRRSFLINPSYETSQGQSFFLDQTGRFSSQRLG